MSASTVIVCIIILVGLILHLAGLFSPYWKVNDPSDTLNDQITRHQGIWIKCTTYVTGNYDCDDFNRSLLGLPIDMIVGRIVGVLGAIIGVIGFIVMGIGSCECITMGKRVRRMLVLTGGVLSIISGFAIIIVMGFYANQIIQDYWLATDQFLRQISGFTRFVFGWSLFVGWIGGAVQVLGGIVLSIIACRHNESEEQPGFTYNTNGSRNYAYRPENPAPLYGKEYV